MCGTIRSVPGFLSKRCSEGEHPRPSAAHAAGSTLSAPRGQRGPSQIPSKMLVCAAGISHRSHVQQERRATAESEVPRPREGTQGPTLGTSGLPHSRGTSKNQTQKRQRTEHFAIKKYQGTGQKNRILTVLRVSSPAWKSQPLPGVQQRGSPTSHRPPGSLDRASTHTAHAGAATSSSSSHSCPRSLRWWWFQEQPTSNLRAELYCPSSPAQISVRVSPAPPHPLCRPVHPADSRGCWEEPGSRNLRNFRVK